MNTGQGIMRNWKYLYVVAENPYYPRGTILEYWETENTVQPVKLVDGRPAGYTGLCVHLTPDVRQHTVALQRRGLDKYKGGFLQ